MMLISDIDMTFMTSRFKLYVVLKKRKNDSTKTYKMLTNAIKGRLKMKKFF